MIELTPKQLLKRKTEINVEDIGPEELEKRLHIINEISDNFASGGRAQIRLLLVAIHDSVLGLFPKDTTMNLSYRDKITITIDDSVARLLYNLEIYSIRLANEFGGTEENSHKGKLSYHYNTSINFSFSLSFREAIKERIFSYTYDSDSTPLSLNGKVMKHSESKSFALPATDRPYDVEDWIPSHFDSSVMSALKHLLKAITARYMIERNTVRIGASSLR